MHRERQGKWAGLLAGQALMAAVVAGPICKRNVIANTRIFKGAFGFDYCRIDPARFG